jgi:uncharacterized RmlC-like cupin family protein
VHLTTLDPRHVRGNHFHKDRREVIIVVSSDRWSLYWDTGAGTKMKSHTFQTPGAVALEVDPLCSHAIRNDGDVSLTIIGISDREYSVENPDSFPRCVVPTPGN